MLDQAPMINVITLPRGPPTPVLLQDVPQEPRLKQVHAEARSTDLEQLRMMQVRSEFGRPEDTGCFMRLRSSQRGLGLTNDSKLGTAGQQRFSVAHLLDVYIVNESGSQLLMVLM